MFVGLLACGLSWLFNYFAMPHIIELLRHWHMGQEIRKEGPQSHMKKQGTPVMGGIGFILSTILSSLILQPKAFLHPLFLIVIVSFVGYGLIGFIDDYLVVVTHHNDGLKPKPKFLCQCLLAAGLVFWYLQVDAPQIYTPFVSNLVTYPTIFFAIIAFVMLVSETNAVNLSDGLDGLSSSLVILALIPFVYYAYREQEMEIFTLLLGMIGGLIAYLHYNKYPAQVMMGDTGSLAMGGIFAASALVLKQEWAIVIVGGVFLAEVLSVVLQVGYFKMTHGKRIFRMAPLHHHFELGGMKETDVVWMFRTAGFVLAIIGIFMGWY